MKYLIDAIMDIAKENPDGFTIELSTLLKVEKGFSVAYNETQDCFGVDGLEIVIEHAKRHGNVVGGWLNEDNNLFYFDSIKIVENEREAIRLGIENEQIAIFDLTNLRLIKL